MRIGIGFVVWAGLVTGAAIVAYKSDQENVDANYSTEALSYLCLAIIAVLVFASIVLFQRPSYRAPCKQSNRSAAALFGGAVTWSHILAVLTGPLESLQLSAVVLYFFW